MGKHIRGALLACVPRLLLIPVAHCGHVRHGCVDQFFLSAPLHAHVTIHHPHFTFPSFFLLRSSRDPPPSHLNFSTHSPFLACRTCLGCYIHNRGSSPSGHAILLVHLARTSHFHLLDRSLISVSCP